MSWPVSTGGGGVRIEQTQLISIVLLVVQMTVVLRHSLEIAKTKKMIMGLTLLMTFDYGRD